MSYIDLYVMAVPVANKEKFIEHAKEFDPMFKEYGALSVVECWGNDIPEGELTSLHKAVMRKDDEQIVAGWVVWPDKATRDKGCEEMMKDERMTSDMPFDGKRMIFGSFDMLFEL